VTFTRASTGTYVGADGLIKTAGNGVARFDHSAAGESLGLLVEEARTNLVTYSEQFDNAAWAKGDVTVTANAVIAPDGTTTADEIVENLVSNPHRVIKGGLPSVAGSDLTVSVFVKRGVGTRNCFILLRRYTGVAWGDCVLNFDTESLTVYSGKNHKLTKLPNGWFKVSFTGTADATGSGEGEFQISFVTSDKTTQVYPGDGTSSIYAWGAQLETGSLLTSYIPTTGSTVTRAADVATLANTGSSIFPTSAFTVVNSPFGTAGGGSTVKLVGPTVKRTAVYNGDLTQAQINALAGVNDDFWRWRVLGSSFALPNFTTNGSVTVDWGDGVVETLTTAVHTFTNGGGYHDIGFRLNSGTFFKPNITDNATYKTRVIATGPAPASMKLDANAGFYGCSALKSFDATVDVSGGTNLGAAWAGCSSLTSFPLINTAAGTNLSFAWFNCSSLTSFPLINTAAATDLTRTWQGCPSLTSFPLITTTSVTNFTFAWALCSGLTSFPLINTSAGTDFNETWLQCSSLTSFPSLNFAAGTNFSYAWQQCNNLATFPANRFDTTGTLVANAFINAFGGCALTATSIENILTSLVTNGQSNITLGLGGGTNANTSTWSAAAKYAYLTLIARGWTITQNGTAPTDADADAYIAAVETADGASLETGVKTAITTFVLGCKVDGTWSAIKASCILAGARTLSGALVPLAGTAPTNNNFVSGDYNRKTGLVGNGSTKYLDSNRNNNADPQNSQHMAVYVSSFVVSPGGYRGFIGGGDNQTGSSNFFVNGTTNILDSRSRYLASAVVDQRALGAALSPGITGLSRNTSASYVVRANGSNTTAVYTSQAPSNINVWVFTANNNGTPAVPTASRLAFYSIGESVDLALLDARVTALITAFGVAIP
jgi:hypothetical protein